MHLVDLDLDSIISRISEYLIILESPALTVDSIGRANDEALDAAAHRNETEQELDSGDEMLEHEVADVKGKGVLKGKRRLL